MTEFYTKPEILSPAGNPEKLHAAVRFGADAVYLAGREFGMRAAADNFSIEELDAAARFLHSNGKKMYVTTNTLMHGGEYDSFRSFLSAMNDIRPDGFIIADLGVFSTIKEALPWASLHVSTQASICSAAAARAWVALGASRLVLARELTLDEIREIRASIPADVELEAFVHGSMCVSYSGRCMLSNALTGRDANRGACTQPCRWNYTLIEEKQADTGAPIGENASAACKKRADAAIDENTSNTCIKQADAAIDENSSNTCIKQADAAIDENASRTYTLIEEKRPDMRIPIEETNLGTFIMSSKDMCMLSHIGELADAGVSSLKIEGRVKSAYYTAVVSNAYRIAVDALDAYVKAGGNPRDFVPDAALMHELEAVSHREYCTGFFYDEPADNAQLVTKPGYVRDKAYLAIADGSVRVTPDGKRLCGFVQRNKLCPGDSVELLSPGKTGKAFRVEALYDENLEPIESTPHPLMKYYMPVPFDALDGDILRAGD